MSAVHYYRYDGYEWAECSSYRVIKTTDKGVWISLGYMIKDKFILNGARKRWAYPTKELALNSFRMRKLRQIEHCRHTEERAKKALDKTGFNAEKELNNFFDTMELWS